MYLTFIFHSSRSPGKISFMLTALPSLNKVFIIIIIIIILQSGKIPTSVETIVTNRGSPIRLFVPVGVVRF